MAQTVPDLRHQARRHVLDVVLPGSLALVRDFGPDYRNQRNKMTTFRPGLRPEGMALRAVWLMSRCEVRVAFTVGRWLMISLSGTGIC